MSDPTHDETAGPGGPTPSTGGGRGAGGDDHVEVRITGRRSRLPFPSSGHLDDDEVRQQLDPHAWSLDPEGRARESEAAALPPDVPVGPDTWFMEAGDLLAQAYCLTLVRGVDVDSAYVRLAAEPSGVDGLLDLDDLVEEAFDGVDDDRYQLAGATPVGGWTLVLEPNGFAATSAERKRALSDGTTSSRSTKASAGPTSSP